MVEPGVVARSLAGTGSNPAGRPESDNYQTPPEATRKLLDAEQFAQYVLEPACGTGAISEVLKEYGYEVTSFDLYDHGYGGTGVDFLHYNFASRAIITNPPFNMAEKFLEHSLELTEPLNGKIALLLKLQFLEGQKRRKLLENSPLQNVYVFSKRLTFSRPGLNLTSGGMMSYAWFVWNWRYVGPPMIKWV